MAIVPTRMNGKYPEGLLSELPGRDGDGTPHRADTLAVASYHRMRRDMAAAIGFDLVPSAGFSCYRTLQDQVYMRSIGATTVGVGKSIHGEALAVDFAGLVGFNSAQYRWLAENAHLYGWYQPAWAKKNGSLPEFWHWEYDYSRDTQPGPPAPPEVPEENDEPNGDEMRIIRNESSGEMVRYTPLLFQRINTTDEARLLGIIWNPKHLQTSPSEPWTNVSDANFKALRAMVQADIVANATNLKNQGIR